MNDITVRAAVTPAEISEHLKIASAAGANVGETRLRIYVGLGMGMTIGQALAEVHLVKGRPVLAASRQLAVIRRNGVKTRWVADGESGTATLQIAAPGEEPVATSFTLDEARKAGLLNKSDSAWTTYPAAMLRARCITKAIRMHCPEYLAVTVYDRDELEDVPAPPRGAAPAIAAGMDVIDASEIEREPEAAPVKPAETRAPAAADDWRPNAIRALQARGLLSDAIEAHGDPETWTAESRVHLRDMVQAAKEAQAK